VITSFLTSLIKFQRQLRSVLPPFAF
jgi:hypothetical protein